MPKIVAYARVSTDKQDAENQRFEITNYLAREGLMYDEFVAETISGTKHVSERKLGGLMEELVKGDTLIVSEASRISRRLAEIFSTITYFIERGVTVIAVKQNFKFGDDIQSQVVAFAFGMASQIERDLISSRTREALARRRAEGKILGRPAGTSDPSKKKLFGKDDEIMAYMDKRVSKSAIARIMDVNWKTLDTYMAEQNLEYKLRSRKVGEPLSDEVEDCSLLIGKFGQRISCTVRSSAGLIHFSRRGRVHEAGGNMEGQIIEIASYETYFNKGKRCVAVTMHDGTIIKLIVTPTLD